MPRKGQKQDPEVQAKITARVKEAWSDPERRKRMSEKRSGHSVSDETRAKISARNQGRVFSPERIEKMRETSRKKWEDPAYRTKVMQTINQPEIKAKNNTPEANEKKRQTKIAYWAKLTPEERVKRLAEWHVQGTASSPKSSIEVLMEQALTNASILFVPRYIVRPYVIDFFLPQWNACLECDGDYWHGERPSQQEHDAKRDAMLSEHGYRVVRVTEAEIMADANAALLRVVCMLE